MKILSIFITFLICLSIHTKVYARYSISQYENVTNSNVSISWGHWNANGGQGTFSGSIWPNSYACIKAQSEPEIRWNTRFKSQLVIVVPKRMVLSKKGSSEQYYGDVNITNNQSGQIICNNSLCAIGGGELEFAANTRINHYVGLCGRAGKNNSATATISVSTNNIPGGQYTAKLPYPLWQAQWGKNDSYVAAYRAILTVASQNYTSGFGGPFVFDLVIPTRTFCSVNNSVANINHDSIRSNEVNDAIAHTNITVTCTDGNGNVKLTTQSNSVTLSNGITSHIGIGPKEQTSYNFTAYKNQVVKVPITSRLSHYGQAPIGKFSGSFVINMSYD
ncbi:hypothetical protein [Providencia alcalifaciens]|uniref:MrpH family fimbial adhesin n=1 Tax=Providencia alcalifaciens TaxID=126385 RepID=UPI0004533210|nr:hypothetical protein [Providencia alcalifaciens]EUD08991.1 hypothetical protein HMPREF1564_1670 [Providencia alcalifaciens R90-1475]